MCLLFKEKDEVIEVEIGGVKTSFPLHSERGDLRTKSAFYTEGYKIAADSLVDRVLTNYQKAPVPGEYDARTAEHLFEPAIIFSYRQFIELKLKHMILFDSKKVDENGSPLDNNTRESIAKSLNHDLIKQWGVTRKILENVIQDKGSEFFKHLDNVEKYIKEFNGIDGDSFSFRYPYDKTINPVPIPDYNFDLEFFKKGMGELYNELEMMSIAIDYEKTGSLKQP